MTEGVEEEGGKQLQTPLGGPLEGMQKSVEQEKITKGKDRKRKRGGMFLHILLGQKGKTKKGRTMGS